MNEYHGQQVRPLWAYLEEQAGAQPDHPAVHYDGRWSSYAELREQVLRTVSHLEALGCKPPDRIAAWSKNRPELIHLYFACAYMGCTFVPINGRLRWEAVAQMCDTTGARILFVERDPGAGVGAALPVHSLDSVGAAAVASGPIPDRDGILARAREVTIDSDVLIASTSGTTGLPKALVYDHRIMLQQHAVVERLAITADDRLLFLSPLYYAPGVQLWLLIMLVSGMSMVVLREFDPAVALDAIEEHRCTLMHGMDTHYVDLCAEQERRPRDLGSLRTGYYAPMFAAVEDVERALSMICPGLVTVYGMTEGSGTTTLGRPDDPFEVKAYTAGDPVSPWTELRIAPDGEVLLRGPFLFNRYLDPELGEGRDEEGWFHTGDLGELDENGRLRLTGRIKDIVRVGGEQLAPAEVEAVIRHHPGVVSVKVVGVPDDRLGEVPVAALVVEDKESFDAEPLRGACEQALPRFKVPRAFVVLDEFPRTLTDKIKRTELRDIVIERLGVDSRRRMQELG